MLLPPLARAAKKLLLQAASLIEAAPSFQVALGAMTCTRKHPDTEPEPELVTVTFKMGSPCRQSPEFAFGYAKLVLSCICCFQKRCLQMTIDIALEMTVEMTAIIVSHAAITTRPLPQTHLAQGICFSKEITQSKSTGCLTCNENILPSERCSHSILRGTLDLTERFLPLHSPSPSFMSPDRSCWSM